MAKPLKTHSNTLTNSKCNVTLSNKESDQLDSQFDSLEALLLIHSVRQEWTKILSHRA